MAVYRLIAESGTGQVQIKRAGKANFSYDPGTEQEIFPGNSNRVPWNLQEYIVYWDTTTSQYVQGSAIVYQSPEVGEFVDENVVVTDPYTSIKGPFNIMQTLMNRREIFGDGDTDNPLWIDNHPGLLSEVSNLNTIHTKNGWHNQEIKAAGTRAPKDILFYYGWVNSFNSGVNAWNNEKVAQDMARYDVIVLGDGIQDPGHSDYSNMTTVVARIKALRPSAKIFGYVTVNQTQGNFETKATQWNTVGVHGIFMDESGYDNGTNRATFNNRVDYVHALSNANICFVNAWNMDHIIGTENDASYPNTTWNPSAVASNLTSSDWYLLESFAVHTTAYAGTGNDGYEAKSQWTARVIKAIGHRYTYGINLAGVGTIDNSHANAQSLFNFSYVAAMMASLDGYGTSDVYYAASSATVTYWNRIGVTDIVDLYSLSPSILVDVGDADVYWRIVKGGRFVLDFSGSDEQYGGFMADSYGAKCTIVAHGEDSGSQTTSTSFVTQLAVTTPYLVPGVEYKVEWYFEVGQDAGYDVEFQVTVGGTVVAGTTLKNDLSASGHKPISGFYRSSSLSGIIDIDVDYRNATGSGNALIRRIRVEVSEIK